MSSWPTTGAPSVAEQRQPAVAPPREPLRIAIVGTGLGRAQAWLATLSKLTRYGDAFRFCGFCEPVPERALENSERWGVPGYPTIRVLLEEQRPDVLLNAAPKDINSLVLGLAAEYGAHLVTEIPLGITPTVGREMVARAAAAGILLEAAEQVWLWPAERLKRQVLTSGYLGEPTRARLVYVNKGDYHGINAVRMLLGREVERVLGVTGRSPIPPFMSYYGTEFETDVWDAGFLEFSGGLNCVFEDPARARMPRRWDVEGTLGQWWGETLWLGGLDDGEAYPIETVYAEVDGEPVFEQVRVELPAPEFYHNPFPEYRPADPDEVARLDLLLGVHAAATGAGELRYGAANAIADLAVMYALRESARRGSAWVELPLAESTPLEQAVHEAFRARYGADPWDTAALEHAVFGRRGVFHEVTGWS